MKIVATNRKAYHDYQIEKTMEAGIVLNGNEIKSIRLGRINLKDNFAKVTPKYEVFVYNMHIARYEKMHLITTFDERRSRKLLLKKKEIIKLKKIVEQERKTLIITKAYFKNNHLKVELAVAKGKKLYDKRHDLKQKTLQKEIDKANKYRY